MDNGQHRAYGASSRFMTAVEFVAGMRVGTVETVAPDEIRVLIDTEAPRATALNTGVPSPFPRINGYVLIPNESGALVGLVVKLWIEHAQSGKGRDTNLVDLPFPLRKLLITPVGTLEWTAEGVRDYCPRFLRGVTVFPSIGDAVLVPSGDQLRAIVESGGETRRVTIGTSPLLANSEIAINPDSLFGGHLAVLGNTGSGKSCSVAGLIRWSLEAAQVRRQEAGLTEHPNARFIVLDPNGEYRTTFADLPGGVRVFQVPPFEAGVRPLAVPAWMWNSAEWAAFAAAAPSVQRPLLQQTLRALRTGSPLDEPAELGVRRRFGFVQNALDEKIASGGAKYAEYGPAQSTGKFLKTITDDSNRYLGDVIEEVKRPLFELSQTAERVRSSRFWERGNGSGYDNFSESDLIDVRDAVSRVLGALPEHPMVLELSEDAPIPFKVQELADHLEQLAASTGSSQTSSFVAGLVVRIRGMLADPRLSRVIAPADDGSLPKWLEDYIGAEAASNGQVAVLDLSLVPTEVVHIAVAVIGRVVFEALQRYRRATESELPTVLVLDEAHTFIPRIYEGEGEITSASQMCRYTFERIAREGRKFGLGLVISSQRPSEISATVLAQCNTFLLHRLVNDRDQELVGKLVPDSLAGMLRELPTLPSRHAILVGQATPVPLLVRMHELPLEHRPRSDNPRFWDTWTGTLYRRIDWPAIAEGWGSEEINPDQSGSDGGTGASLT